MIYWNMIIIDFLYFLITIILDNYLKEPSLRINQFRFIYFP
jgi:hypothetical protein